MRTPRSLPVLRERSVTETETTSVDAPLNPAKSTSDDAPVSATDGPVARTAHAALIDTVAAKLQPPSATSIGTAANGADADPAFAAVYRRGREVLGADADAVTAKLLSACNGDAEDALDTLACAEEESDPRQYIEREIEAAGHHRDGASM